MNLASSSSPRSDNLDIPGGHYCPWREWELWTVALLVGLIYCGRLTTVPICGEESRWANVAREMIASGDWIVPRQQGQVFAERPPLGSWAMAMVGLLRGQVDAVAVRLPSALATTALAMVIYLYGRIFLARRGALAAALAYGTFGQVLQIGRLGESEALFSFLLASALLAWHAGYVRGWTPALIWGLGYTLTALAALVKGPQAPVYFVAVTGAFLVWRRQSRWLLAWQHALGVAIFAGLIAAWQVPFWLATDGKTVVDVWSGLARDRFSFGGLFKHLVSYPLETFGCLLPWSALLVALADPRFRRTLGAYRELLTFLLTALVVTYPTVWLSAGARGRYYMPLYPCFALLVGMVIERCTAADAAAPMRRGWQWYLGVIGSVAAAIGVAVAVAAGIELKPLAVIRLPALLGRRLRIAGRRRRGSYAAGRVGPLQSAAATESFGHRRTAGSIADGGHDQRQGAGTQRLVAGRGGIAGPVAQLRKPGQFRPDRASICLLLRPADPRAALANRPRTIAEGFGILLLRAARGRRPRATP